jgi:glutathione synthase/RimK-type ligase-like ATP-grasp enzyme
VTVIALATCTDLPSLVADDASFVAALRDRGVSVEPVVWSDRTVDWNRYDVVVRSIWDYYERPGEFAAWVDDVEAASCDVWNRPATLRWNSHKFYLRELADRGVRTLPTAYVERGRDLSLAAAFEERGWGELVVKPAVSAGASRTRHIARSEADAEQSWVDDLVAANDVLVQAFADDIAAGEWSLVFFGDEYSHAVVKRPQPGDFRVQEDQGGSVDAGTPGDPVRRQAARVVEAVTDVLGHSPLYARVDGVERRGAFHLLEVELVEPEPFFRVDPASGRRLADRLRSVI